MTWNGDASELEAGGKITRTARPRTAVLPREKPAAEEGGMTATTNPREENLPKWARGELERLRRDLAYMQRLLNEARGQGESRFAIAQYSAKTGRGFHRLDSQARHIAVDLSMTNSVFESDVYYRSDDMAEVSVVDGLRGKPELVVQSVQGALAVKPWASNVVRIRVDG